MQESNGTKFISIYSYIHVIHILYIVNNVKYYKPASGMTVVIDICRVETIFVTFYVLR